MSAFFADGVLVSGSLPEGNPPTTHVMFRPLGVNGDGIDVAWPAESIGCFSDDPVLDGWTKMDNATFAAHVAARSAAVVAADFLKIKTTRKAELQAEVRDFIHAHYRPEQQASLQMVLASGSAPAKAYVQQAVDWVKEAIALYYPARDAVDAATTPEGVSAVAIDYSGLSADPLISLETALSL